jgi:hypothetical protein
LLAGIVKNAVTGQEGDRYQTCQKSNTTDASAAYDATGSFGGGCNKTVSGMALSRVKRSHPLPPSVWVKEVRLKRGNNKQSYYYNVYLVFTFLVIARLSKSFRLT